MIKLKRRASVMFEAGSVIEPAPEEGARLIRVGLAEEVTEAPAEKPKEKKKTTKKKA
jgi:hypothetical protein